MILEKEDFNDGYYHLGADLKEYPEAWCYIVWSRRGPGKTYSGLWYAYYNNLPIAYVKRTIDDVDVICAGDIENETDFSPYAPINRDKFTNIHARKILNGIGGFWEYEGLEPKGAPVSYIIALNAIKKIKGFDLSKCEWILFDEFIPQQGEIVKRKEGEMLLDVYMTVNRDRQKRGRPPLKLILFANAEEISTPVTNTLEVVDTIAEMNAANISKYYDVDRGIFFHHITSDEIPIQEEETDGIYQAMKMTAWGRKAFGGEFANNDFSNVTRQNIKNCKAFIHLKYKTYDYYIYLNQKTGMYYMCEIPHSCIFEYDLNKENGQKLFYLEHCIDLRLSCMEEKMKFSKYSMYDLIVNYKQFFKV